MLNLLKKSLFELYPPVFGVDLSDLSVKMVKLKQRGRYLELESFNKTSIPDGVITGGEVVNIPKAAEMLRSTMKAAKGVKFERSHYVVASLPEEQSFIRLIQLPKMKIEEAEAAVRYEAENNIPFPLEEVYLDYQIIPPLLNHLDHFDILIVATPRKIIDSYIACFREAGLIARALEVESIAIVRSMISGEIAEEPVLIIDLGETRTSFIIFSGRTIRFTSSTEISGKALTDAISRELGVGLQEAEILKKKYGLSRKGEGGDVFGAMIPVLTDLKEQIHSYMMFYREHASHEHRRLKDPSRGNDITKVLLTGGGAALKGLENYFALELKVSCEKANPWVNILQPPLREVPELPYEESLGYTTALGLALRGMRTDNN